MLFAGRTFSADALRGLRRPSHKTQYDSETVTLSRRVWLLVIREVEKTPLGSMEAFVTLVIDVRGTLLVHNSYMPGLLSLRQSSIVKLVLTLELMIRLS